ncbi:TetR/AcrR family transcriptional regulator [Microbacterium saperdae]|uniref:TetR family transcriptional regulator n=1 Tax=Microbacterium saperdae TaxID=69368 RepID=A0A543BN19_9MICO|nr:TetR/AcrR family transcriptional regulator [Microbacterium saperdae]TQL86240.1 TetR family transcriptional regulator [Microbacterium saperdae]GGM49519.1 hypothetical protein GCM10010489_21190 [Microbacterium saperdae]
MTNERQRDRILDAAATLAVEAGLDAVTVRAVAGAAGVGMGTLRHYFPAQGALHTAVVQRVLEDTIENFDIQDTTLDPGDRLARCVLQFLPDEATERQLLEVWFGMYRHALEPGANSAAVSFLEVAVRRSHARITAWLEQLADEGSIDGDRVDESVLLLSALVSGICLEIVTPGAAMTVASARNLLDRSARDLIVKEHA